MNIGGDYLLSFELDNLSLFIHGDPEGLRTTRDSLNWMPVPRHLRQSPCASIKSISVDGRPALPSCVRHSLIAARVREQSRARTEAA
jgi:hypothetical protein